MSTTSTCVVVQQQEKLLDVMARMMAEHIAKKMAQNHQFEKPSGDQNVSRPPSKSSPPSAPTTDIFDSVGSWEAHAAEHNVRAVKRTRRIRRIRRLSENESSDESSDSDNRPATLSLVELVPNPFCISSAAATQSSIHPIKIKRVCFNPTISYHYF